MLLSILLPIILITGCTSIKEYPNESLSLEYAGASGQTEPQALALDPAVHTGELENGLTWYIRENHKPEARASLRLVVRAGSILEDEDQQGIAHLVEHMAFNGTENFEKMDLVNYLESIGMAFGPEINAYTSFDETVYMLEIPTDDEEILSQALLILEDWARGLSFESGEIEKERGVVREEWRLGRGASGRIRDQILPVLLGGSLYAHRLPIGDMDVVMNTPADRVRDFYHEWYRPELMALVIVGDVDAAAIEERIVRQFSTLENNPGRERQEFSVPINETPAVKVVSDPEVQTASFELSIKTATPSFRTEADYKGYLVRSIFWGIFNDRLGEVAQEPEAPFIGAQGGQSQFVATRSFISYSGLLSPGDIGPGLFRTIQEVEKIMTFGVLPGELKRQKADHMTFIESAWQDRDNRRSSALAQELVSFFLQDIFMPGLEAEYELFSRLLPEITAEDINIYGRTILPARGRSLSVIIPESAVGSVPAEEDLLEILAEAEARIPEALTEETLPDELMKRPEAQGKILDREEFPEPGLTLWTLNNGTRIAFKQTDFMEDEILFQAFSPGGVSLLSDEEYHAGAYATLFLSESGLAGFSAADLGKILAGRDVRVTPYIQEFFEGFYGSTSPGDLEVLFQLFYLYFHDPEFSSISFENVRSRLVPLIENRKADPITVFNDRFNEIINSGAFRARPLDEDILNALSLEEVSRLFKERFASPNDFTFLFVGNIDPELLSDYAEAYLSGAVSGAAVSSESWIDRGIRPPEGRVAETVVKGLDPQSRVTLYFHGEGDFSREEKIILPVLGEMLQTKLREILREDLSGTYSVRSSLNVRHFPYSGWSGVISFGCDPRRADELSDKVTAVIDEVKDSGLSGEYFTKAIKKYRRDYETGMRENSFWMEHLFETLRNDDEIKAPLPPEEFESILGEVSVEKIASRVYGSDFIRLTLQPENEQ